MRPSTSIKARAPKITLPPAVGSMSRNPRINSARCRRGHPLGRSRCAGAAAGADLFFVVFELC